MSAKKKSFENDYDPVFDFISPESVEAVDGPDRTAAQECEADQTKEPERVTEPAQKERVGADQVPDGFKADPRYIEKKTKRVQLILRPSLYVKVKEAADREGLSLNEYVHQVLEADARSKADN